MIERFPDKVCLGFLGLILACGIGVAAGPTTMPSVSSESADVASPKRSDGQNTVDSRFLSKHESFIRRGREGRVGLLFLGDSITEGWTGAGKQIWNQAFSAYAPANFGISGDRTQHLLWRIENGELDHINPRVVILMIGTNNIGTNTAGAIAAADVKIVAEIHRKLPDAMVLLLGIFPRGEFANDPAREIIRSVNAELSRLTDYKLTRFIDLSSNFLSPDGSLSRTIMPDFLHPNAQGYQIWADALHPLLAQLMN